MKTAFAAALLAASTLILAACDSAEAPAAKAPEGIAGMTITNPRVVLAPVAGNPAAVYFDMDYEGEGGIALNRAQVKGTKSAMFHDYGEWDSKMQMQDMLPLPLKKGDKIEFKPGGKHIMAMDPSPDLKPGGTTEVTVVVSGGAKQTFTAPIKAAGDER
jgi:copper(I)-binding protein